MKIIIIILLLSSLLLPQEKWQKLNGPEGGKISAIISRGDTIIIGTGYDKGLIYYSLNRGLNWSKANFKLSFPNGIGARVNDFVLLDDNTVLAACGAHGIFKSTDLINWELIFQNGEYYWSLIKDFSGSIFTGTHLGKIYCSSNNGVSWFFSFNGTLNQSIHKFANAIDSSVVAGTFGKIYKKAPMEQWETINLNYSSQLFSPTVINNELYINSGSYLLKSTNVGFTWIQLDTAQFWIGNYAEYFYINDQIFFATFWDANDVAGGYGVAVSYDKGFTWRWSNNGLPPRFYSAYKMINVGLETYVTIDAAGIYKSTNYGDSWFSSNNGLYAASVNDISFDNQNSLYAACWSNGLFKSTDKGESWQRKENGFTNSYIYTVISDTNGYLLAGTGEGFFRSTDGGENWSKGVNVGNNFFINFYLDKRNRIYARLYGSGIYRTTNFGVTWTKITNGFASSYVSSFYIDEKNNHFYAGAGNGYIYRSVNDGANWSLLRSTPYLQNSMIGGIAVAPNGHIFAANTSEGVLRSTDSGVTWVNKDNGLLNYAMTCLVVNEKGELYLSTQGDKLHYSSDEGENWIDVTDNLDKTWVRDMEFDEHGNLYLATDESVWRVKDIVPVELSFFCASVEKNNVTLKWKTETELNNSGFEVQRSNSDESTWDILSFIKGSGTKAEQTEYIFEDRNLHPGIYNYRLKQLDYNGSYKFYRLANEVSINLPLKYKLEQNYPNPFNPVTTIKYQIPEEGEVTIKVYDVLGKEIKTLLDEVKSPGNYELHFNAENISTGVYFYRVTSGSFSDIKKMQVIK